jgi:hypothetical protein
VKLLRQPDDFTCVPTAFAMALDLSLEAMLLAPKPYHPGSLIPMAVAAGWTVTPLVLPYCNPANWVFDRRGVIIGQRQGQDGKHAVAWDGRLVYDPKGKHYGLQLFDIDEFYWCHRIM